MKQEDIEQRIERATALHEGGHNCAQSVICACCDLVGLDEATAFKVMEGLGRGMGDHSETCGALSAGVSLLGFARSDGPHNPTTKAATYELAKQLVDQFREKNGSTICCDLKGLNGRPKLQECSVCINDCVRMTIELLAHVEQEAG